MNIAKPHAQFTCFTTLLQTHSLKSCQLSKKSSSIFQFLEKKIFSKTPLDIQERIYYSKVAMKHGMTYRSTLWNWWWRWRMSTLPPL